MGRGCRVLGDAGPILAWVFLACRAPETRALVVERAPQERVAFVALDEDGLPSDARVIAPDAAATNIEVPLGATIALMKLDEADFVDAEGRLLDEGTWDELVIRTAATPQLLRSPIQCSLSWPKAPILVHPGDRCPVPAFVEIGKHQVTEDGLLAQAWADGEREGFDDRVQLAWPGEPRCGDAPFPPSAASVPLEEIETSTPGLPSTFLQVTNTGLGHVAVYGPATTAVVHPDGHITRRAEPEPIAIQGLSDGRFVVAQFPSQRPMELQLLDTDLAVLARASISTTLRWPDLFFEGGLVVGVGGSSDSLTGIFVCDPDATPFECREVLMLTDVLAGTKGRGLAVARDGAALIFSSNGEQVILERVPRPSELPATGASSSETSGSIQTTQGPIAWRVVPALMVDGVPFLDPEGTLADHGLGQVGDRLVLCASRAFTEGWVLTATLSASMARSEGLGPEWASLLGPYSRRCRASAAGAAVRLDFDQGSYLDLSEGLSTIECAGEPCNPPQAPPLAPSPLVRVSSELPGWAIGVTPPARGLFVRRNASGPAFRGLARQLGWRGTIAARGRELWVFGSGDRRWDDEALARMTPPIVVSRACTGSELCLASAWDRAADELVVIGRADGTERAFIRRVTPQGAIREVPIPDTLELDAALQDLAEIMPGRILIASSDARLFLLEGEAIQEIDVDWDDPATMVIERAPDACDDEDALGRRPLLRAVAQSMGIGIVVGCQNVSMRVWAHTSPPYAEGIGVGVEVTSTSDFLASAGPCPNQRVGANPEPFGAVVPLEQPRDNRDPKYRYVLLQISTRTGSLVDLLDHRDQVIAVGNVDDEGTGTIRVVGAPEITGYDDRFQAAAINDQGEVLILTDRGNLVLGKVTP